MKRGQIEFVVVVLLALCFFVALNVLVGFK